MGDRLMIEASGLEKSYGAVRVLSGVDLEVEQGRVLALLGPNGAGKTTTVRILATLARADAGAARVAGFDVVAERRQVRRHISLTGQYAALDELQTGEENLRMMGRLSGLSPAAAGRRAGARLDRFDRAEGGRRPHAPPSGGPGPASCWSGSTWPRPAGARWRPGRAACAGASTWPPAWSGTRR